MKIIKLVPLTGNFSMGPERSEGTGAAEPSDREPHGATDWFVNVRSGTTSRALLADLYKAAGPEKWSSIASYVEGIKRQERGRLNGTERARASEREICSVLFVLVANPRGIPELILLRTEAAR